MIGGIIMKKAVSKKHGLEYITYFLIPRML